LLKQTSLQHQAGSCGFIRKLEVNIEWVHVRTSVPANGVVTAVGWEIFLSAMMCPYVE